jgi:hypothetical protein
MIAMFEGVTPYSRDFWSDFMMNAEHSNPFYDKVFVRPHAVDVPLNVVMLWYLTMTRRSVTPTLESENFLIIAESKAKAAEYCDIMYKLVESMPDYLKLELVRYDRYSIHFSCNKIIRFTGPVKTIKGTTLQQLAIAQSIPENVKQDLIMNYIPCMRAPQKLMQFIE